MLAAGPSDEDRLGLVAEYKRVLGRLSPRHLGGKLRHLPEVRADELVQVLQDNDDVRVVHFSGHGRDDGDLLFVDEDGLARPLSPETFVRVLRRFEHLEGVVLNACHTAGLAAKLAKSLARQLHWVVGMDGEIADTTAQDFAAHFYAGLASNKFVETAFGMALVHAEIVDEEQAKVPQLYVGGERFDPQGEQAERYDEDVERYDEDVESPVSREELDLYRNRLRGRYGTLPILGFKSEKRISMRLGSLCVTLRTDADPHRRSAHIQSEKDLAEKHSPPSDRRRESMTLADAIAYAQDQGEQGLVLLGDPGTGKSTFLLQTLLGVFDEGAEAFGLPAGTVPVFLRLQQLRDSRCTLGEFIQAQLPQHGRGFTSDFGTRLVRRGKLLVLLDGLDEVAGLQQREQVKEWIEDELGGMDDSYVLVSCRYAGYVREVEFGPKFIELNLRKLDDAQLHDLVHNWYTLVEKLGLPDGESASQRAEALLATLNGPRFSSSQLYEMSRNPLLVTGICWIHYQGGQLVDQREEIYEQCVEALAKRWRDRDPQSFPLPNERSLEPILRPMAGWMHERQVQRSNASELREPLEHALARNQVHSVSASEFLRGVQEDAGLLSSIGDDQVEFVHFGFQEFLAARDARARNDFDGLARHFDNSWWREVILLLLARPGAFDPFMRALARRPDFVRLCGTELMQMCLAEAPDVSEAPFDEALAKLGDEAVHRQAVVDCLQSVKRRRGIGHASATDKVVAGIELALVPGGRFWMGTDDEDEQVFDEERPRHEVELAPFYLARTPVTNAQYRRYLETNPAVPKPKHWGDRQFNQPQQPVVGVSWHEARDYCDWAGLALPTEAQWEYACRAGTTTRFWSGDDEADLARVGWYLGNSEDHLHPVAIKPANALGLYDMHGNVWEWCQDNFGPYTAMPRTGDGSRHDGRVEGTRVVRGGGWFYVARHARAAVRVEWQPNKRDRIIGFRPIQRISSA
jgi:formylglycine-generating enzyme required for sulfatase activity